MTDDEQDFFNKSIGKLEKEIIALKKEYQAECHRADELEDSLQKSWRNENKLKKQLDIAIEALDSIVSLGGFPMMNMDRFAGVASDALCDIAAVDEKRSDCNDRFNR